MVLLRRVISGFGRLFHRNHVEQELDEEVRDYLARATEQNTQAGMTPEAALRAARVHVGSLEVVKDGARDVGWESVADALWQDLRYAIRILRKAPGFTVVAVLTLSLGIGANAAIFAVINALLFQPVPVVAPQELARVHSGESQMSWLNYQDIREGNVVFLDVAAHRLVVAGLATQDTPQRLRGELTSANYLTLLGVNPALGRVFVEKEARRDLVVIAEHMWRTRFGADPAIIGRALTLGAGRYEIVGVMPRGFRGVAPPGMLVDFWMPVDTAAPNRTLSDRQVTQFEVIGRLKPNVEDDQATAAMQVLVRQMRTDHPELSAQFLETTVFPISGLGAFQGMASLLVPIFAFLALMTIVSGFVLLIGCVNIAGLLIGRAAARRREIAMRLALGAGRWRLVRQLLTESLLLALIGGTGGILLAVWLTGGINAIASRLPIPVEFDLHVGWRVLTYTLGLTTLTSIMFGLAPARRAARFDLVSSLKDDSGSTSSQKLRHGLVVAQVAMCSMLLVWSGLFVRSLGHINEVNPGFDPTGVLLASLELERGSVDDRTGEQIFVEFQQRVRESPGVQAVGMSAVVPLALTGREEFSVSIDGTGGETRHRVFGNRLTPGWFDTVRIPLVVGRDFTWDDREVAPGVVIVNETLARRLWSGDALGKRLTYGKKSLQVIGVARDSKYRTLGETIAPTVYQPLLQAYMWQMTLHVRTADMKATTDVINREVRRLAPDAVVDIEPMTRAVSVAVVPAQIGAAATGACGVVAMLLSALGVYGLVSFVVVQRTREVAIRRAIGARTLDIVRLIVGGYVGFTALGLVIGLGVGALGAAALRGFLTGVTPIDPWTLAAVASVVMTAALTASALPALRATHVDPLITLRDV